MSVPERYIINDIRSKKEFDTKSFSGYNIKDVIRVFKKSMKENNIETSCNWCIELILSMKVELIYETLLIFFAKSVHISCPSITKKVLKRFKQYKQLLVEDCLLRNIQMIRNHIIELTIIACMSKKSKQISFKPIHITDMDINIIKSNFTATEYIIDHLFKSNDPIELKYIINEFVYNIKKKNYDKCNYIISWVIFYDKQLAKKKTPLTCHNRFSHYLENNLNDIVWFLWEILLIESYKAHKFAQLQINYLFKLYIFLYEQKYKYKYFILYLFALKYITDNYDISTPIIYNNGLLIEVGLNINNLFEVKREFEITQPINKIYPVKTKIDIPSVGNSSLSKFDIISHIDNIHMKN